MQRRGLRIGGDNEEEEEEEGLPPSLTPAERKRQEALQKKRRGVEITAENASVTRVPTTTTTKEAQPLSSSVSATEAFSTSTTTSTTTTTTRGEESLLSLVKRMRKEEEQLDPATAQRKKLEEEEARVLESAIAASTQALVSAKEKANDVRFRERIVRKWPGGVPEAPEVLKSIQDSRLILVDGQNVPPPISKFENMNLPPGIVRYLVDVKNIYSPTPIQMQGMPVALSGRDMIGVASTGSGKTLSFLIPAVVVSLEAEDSLSSKRLRPGEGPFVLILGPSRELQRQTYQIAQEMCDFALGKGRMSFTLAIGGENKIVQLADHKSRGTHILIGTPGRVQDFLNSRQMSLSRCTMIVLDEGDRMMDEGFDDEVKKIIGYFEQRPRQTVLFSATMPRRVVDFAREALVDAVVVNVGRAGAASANITQYAQAVKRDERFVTLLEALERTTPPVLIFCTKNSDVDDVHEYLLLKGVEARGIHAGKSQQDRNQAVDEFKAKRAEVLVASDVAAKGLDFPQIEHVINFDMPADIETYVHRIGRTGRGGKKGVATTFVDMSGSPNFTLLGDLAGILREAKQRVPLFLTGGPEGEYEEPVAEEESSSVTCSVCGGFGHRIINCPKLASIGKKNLTRDVVTGGDY